MQPTFPPDHHFYRHRRGARPVPGSGEGRRLGAAQDAGYLTRHTMPALDPSDPREGH